MKFECVYPWGSTYSETLMNFLDEHGIPWCNDPRTEGGDSYGLLIANSQETLSDMETRIQEIMDKIDTAEEAAEDTDDLWAEAWEISSEEVLELVTDWKHLEIYDHPEELKKVGVRLDLLWENHDPPYIIELSLIEE